MNLKPNKTLERRKELLKSEQASLRSITITFYTTEIRMLIREDVQTVRLLREERRCEGVRQTEEFSSEYSVVCVCVWATQAKGKMGGGGGVRVL
jgi:hypothetical protein